jgi:hypothetical protein
MLRKALVCDLFRREEYVVVEIEVSSKCRNRLEIPTHALLIGRQFTVGCLRYGDHPLCRADSDEH